jgi:hypothetical protein
MNAHSAASESRAATHFGWPTITSTRWPTTRSASYGATESLSTISSLLRRQGGRRHLGHRLMKITETRGTYDLIPKRLTICALQARVLYFGLRGLPTTPQSRGCQIDVLVHPFNTADDTTLAFSPRLSGRRLQWSLM